MMGENVPSWLHAIGIRLRQVFAVDREPLSWPIVDSLEKIVDAEEALSSDEMAPLQPCLPPPPTTAP